MCNDVTLEETICPGRRDAKPIWRAFMEADWRAARLGWRADPKATRQVRKVDERSVKPSPAIGLACLDFVSVTRPAPGEVIGHRTMEPTIL